MALEEDWPHAGPVWIWDRTLEQLEMSLLGDLHGEKGP